MMVSVHYGWKEPVKIVMYINLSQNLVESRD